MILGDSIVFWRAWVVSRGKFWVLLVPSIMFLMTFGKLQILRPLVVAFHIVAVFAVMDMACQWVDFQATIDYAGPAICTSTDLISWAFSAATNIACTVVIGLKARYVAPDGKIRPLTSMYSEHRKMMRGLDIAGNSGRLTTETILSILVESGFIYSLFWVRIHLLRVFSGLTFCPVAYSDDLLHPVRPGFALDVSFRVRRIWR